MSKKKDDKATSVKENGKHSEHKSKPKKLEKKFYKSELERLQLELVKLQEWVKAKGPQGRRDF